MGNELESKEDLEIKKLFLEIKQLNLKWWQRPSYLAAVVPLMISVLTFAGAFISGWFSQERENLNAQIYARETQILALQNTLESLRDQESNLTEDLNTQSGNFLNAAQEVTVVETDIVSGWLVVFSTDPALRIEEAISAEFEVKLAQDRLNRQAIVLQRGDLFSTAIPFESEQDALNKLDSIRENLNRPSAFVTSMEGFCQRIISEEKESEEKESIGDGTRYKYELIVCGIAN